jgi:hypothetical protein
MEKETLSPKEVVHFLASGSPEPKINLWKNILRTAKTGEIPDPNIAQSFGVILGIGKFWNDWMVPLHQRTKKSAGICTLQTDGDAECYERENASAEELNAIRKLPILDAIDRIATSHLEQLNAVNHVASKVQSHIAQGKEKIAKIMAKTSIDEWIVYSARLLAKTANPRHTEPTAPIQDREMAAIMCNCATFRLRTDSFHLPTTQGKDSDHLPLSLVRQGFGTAITTDTCLMQMGLRKILEERPRITKNEFRATRREVLRWSQYLSNAPQLPFIRFSEALNFRTFELEESLLFSRIDPRQWIMNPDGTWSLRREALNDISLDRGNRQWMGCLAGYAKITTQPHMNVITEMTAALTHSYEQLLVSQLPD